MVEQRDRAVMEVLTAGASKTEVAARYGVSRQSVHSWVRRYEDGRLAGLADRSHRPRAHPGQIPPEVEAVVSYAGRIRGGGSAGPDPGSSPPRTTTASLTDA